MNANNTICSSVFSASGLDATAALAAELAAQCVIGDCILLRGELGAGKTAFARGFIHGLQAEKTEVASPTFAIAQQYAARDGKPIWHFDLYRLESPAELAEIGLDEALADAITLVEWPDMAQELLPADALSISIDFGAAEGERVFTFRGDALRWSACLAALKSFSKAA